VNLDGCVEVDAAFYSAPPGWIGRQVKVQWDERTVRVLDPRTGQLLREHLRQERGRYHIEEQDKPDHMLPSTTRLLARCAAAGPNIGALCQRMYQDEGVVAIRRSQGILSLAK
jgi:hypothetical protein